MDFVADFTAIDFETANRRRDSACQLAAVIVRGGRIVDQAMWMIRPDPLEFSPGNVRIHGITPGQVRGEPVFGELWTSIWEKLAEGPLVAHNASFDMGVLLACLRSAGKAVPEMQFACTRSVARRTWPHRPGFGLKPLAEWLGIRFRHHDALEDSIACAKIMLAAGIDREATSLEDLEKRLRITRGRAGQWGYRGASSKGRSRAGGDGGRSRTKLSITRTAQAVASTSADYWVPASPVSGSPVSGSPVSGSPPGASPSTADQTSESELQRLLVRAEFIRPLAGKRVVLSDRLASLRPDQAKRLATSLGAECQGEVDQSTDFLVVIGHKHAACPAETAAEEFRASGTAIEIMDEQTLISLVVAPAIG